MTSTWDVTKQETFSCSTCLVGSISVHTSPNNEGLIAVYEEPQMGAGRPGLDVNEAALTACHFI